MSLTTGQLKYAARTKKDLEKFNAEENEKQKNRDEKAKHLLEGRKFESGRVVTHDFKKLNKAIDKCLDAAEKKRINEEYEL